MGKRTRTVTLEPIPEKPLPASSKDVTVDGSDYTAITEGCATVLFPKSTVKRDENGREVEVKGEVFYNPIQQFNRDLSVLAIKNFAEIYLGEKKSKRGKGGAKKQWVEVTVAKGEGEEPAASEENGKDVSAMNSGPMPTTQTQPRFAVLDALSATGLRALRYTLELPMVTSATANDLDPSAVDSIRRNIEYNKQHSTTTDPDKMSAAEAVSKIKPSLGNAQHHMYSVLSPAHHNLPTREPQSLKYEVIDLDPYGTAAIFLDAAVQAVSNGGLLCVTCTDAGVWASTGYSEKCYSLYGGTPAKGEWCHEAGLRLILHSIASAAGKYGLYIEPLLSLSIDFYARVWVRIRHGPAEVKKLASSTMIVYNCDEGCGSWVTQTLGKAKENANKSGSGTFLKFGLARAPTVGENCAECGSVMHLGGPMWAGPLHSAAFVERFLSILPPADDSMYGTIPRITGMLQTALQEIPLSDSPFFHVPSLLSKTLRCEAPPNAGLRGALIGLGYKVARSHCKPNSIKTNAPHSVVWQIMKRWVLQKAGARKENALKEGTAGFNIMQKPLDEGLRIVFDKELGKEEDKASGIVRYQVNPTANWGPMARAGPSASKPPQAESEGSENKKRKVESN